MSNSTERKRSRKQEHPRTLTFRSQSYPETYESQLEEMYYNMNSENTSYFGDAADEFPKNIGHYRFAFALPNKVLSFGILKYGFEKEIDTFYSEHQNNTCDCAGPWDTFHDTGVNTFEDDSPYRFFYCIGNKNDDSDDWHFDLHIHSSIQPIICHAMTQVEYELYYAETYGLCYECKEEIGYMTGQCADCYWEEDSRRKARRRGFYSNNPDLLSAWQSHCRHTFYPNEEIEVSELLRNHIPKSIESGSKEYDAYIQRFKLAIVDGMFSVMSLLKEMNPEYETTDETQENQMK